MSDITNGLNGAGKGHIAKEVGKFIHIWVGYDGNDTGDSAQYEIKVVSHPMYLWDWSIEKLEDLGEVDMIWSVSRYSDIPNKVLIMADHGKCQCKFPSWQSCAGCDECHRSSVN